MGKSIKAEMEGCLTRTKIVKTFLNPHRQGEKPQSPKFGRDADEVIKWSVN